MQLFQYGRLPALNQVTLPSVRVPPIAMVDQVGWVVLAVPAVMATNV